MTSEEIISVKCDNFFSALVTRVPLPIGTAPSPSPLLLAPVITDTSTLYQLGQFVPITSSVPWRSCPCFQLGSLQKAKKEKKKEKRKRKRKEKEKDKRARTYTQWCAERQKKGRRKN